MGRIRQNQIGLWMTSDSRRMAPIEMYHGNLESPDIEAKSAAAAAGRGHAAGVGEQAAERADGGGSGGGGWRKGPRRAHAIKQPTLRSFGVPAMRRGGTGRESSRRRDETCARGPPV